MYTNPPLDNLDKTKAAAAIKTMAEGDPAYQNWRARHPGLPTMSPEAQPMAVEALRLLAAEKPGKAETIQALVRRPVAQPTPFGPMVEPANLATLAAVLFMLRSHLIISRDAHGTWSFHVNYKGTHESSMNRIAELLKKAFEDA